AILRALAELQITDPTHPQYGGFRWYREETQINDTNAAFFIIMPLITLQLSHPEVISVSQLQVLKEMLTHASAWFSHECREPILYYPNKIISDGAMLLAISAIMQEEKYYQEGVQFFENWNGYT